MAIGNFFGLLESNSMIAPQTNGNKIDNIMDVTEFIIFCVIKYHSYIPITIGNLIWSIRYIIHANVKHHFLILFIPYKDHTISVGKVNRQITCINYSLRMRRCNNCIHT